MPFSRTTAYAFNPEAIREGAPDRAGVFALFNPTEWVYIGDAENMRQALFDVLNASGPLLESHQPLSFSCEEEADASERQRRRDAVIAELKPAFRSRHTGDVPDLAPAGTLSRTEPVVVELKRVLCPVDLTELSIRPLRYAAAVAKWYGAHLTALHVVPTFDAVQVREGELFDPVRIVYPMRRDQVLEQIRRIVSAADIAVDDVALAAEQGEPVATIIDQSLARSSDVVVMGTHGRSGVDRWLLGSVTDKVLRQAPCPVLVVPPHVAGASTDVRPASILCPIDFSDASLQALGFALEVARRARARVTVMHVIEWLAEEQPPDSVEVEGSAVRRALERRAGERLQTILAQQAPASDAVTTTVVSGRAHRAILHVARDEHADLIVMGAQGRGGVALALLGSTTEQVVRAAAVPVLTVRAPII